MNTSTSKPDSATVIPFQGSSSTEILTRLLIRVFDFLVIYFTLTVYNFITRVNVRRLSLTPLLKVFFRCIGEFSLSLQLIQTLFYRDAAGYCFM